MAQAPLTSDAYPYLRIRFRIGPHESDVVLALLDTGFDGRLAIPKRLDRSLGLPDYQLQWELADGSVVRAPIYIGMVEIIDLPPFAAPITVMTGNDYIIGRGILDRFKVTFDRGQRVILEP